MDGAKYNTDTVDMLKNEHCGKRASFLRRSFFERNSGAGRNENPGRSKN
jgi:hypothetical protein